VPRRLGLEYADISLGHLDARVSSHPSSIAPSARAKPSASRSAPSTCSRYVASRTPKRLRQTRHACKVEASPTAGRPRAHRRLRPAKRATSASRRAPRRRSSWLGRQCDRPAWNARRRLSPRRAEVAESAYPVRDHPQGQREGGDPRVGMIPLLFLRLRRGVRPRARRVL
jgi:hypothetical protein